MVSVFAGIGPVSEDLLNNDIDVQCLEHGHFKDQGTHGGIHGIWDKETGQTFNSFMGRFPLEETVVHVHSFRDSLSAAIWPALWERKHATVYTAHDYGLACPYGGFYDFTEKKICPKRGGSVECLKTRCNNGSYPKKLWFFAKHWAQGHIGEVPKLLKHAIFVSKFSQRVLDSYFPQTTRRHLVDNPIDIVQQPRRLGSPDAPFLFVGALVEHKDPLALAQAAKDLGVPAMFVGDGPLAEEIKRVYPEATLTGWLATEAVRKYVRESRALVFPSVWYEAQPLTVLEALADGVPVICSDANAGTEEVVASKGGLLFKSRDVESLKEAMSKALDEDINTELSVSAYDGYWTRPRTMAKHIEDLMPIYYTALAGAE